MSEHQHKLAEDEEKLADPTIYEASRKPELTDTLQHRTAVQAQLEEIELAWLDAQEELEALLASES